MNSTDRYVHFNRNGAVTARLEIMIKTADDNYDSYDGFVAAHADAVKKCFDTTISEAADASYERFAAQDRAYRFRPYLLAVEYESARRRGAVTLAASVTLSTGRRVIACVTEHHRFRVSKAGIIYIGTDKV